MKQRKQVTVLIMIICLAASACCPTCREQTISAPEIYEEPELFRLRYKYWPTQYLQDFAVIQGGQEYVLTPDGDGTWSLQ